MDLTAKNLGLTRRFTQPVVEATLSTFQDFLAIPVKLSGMCEFDGESPFEINVAIGISGAGHGALVLSMSGALARRAAGAMLFQEFADVDDLVLDFVGELANMIGGSAKKQLDFLGFRLGIPDRVPATELTRRFPANAVPVTLNFDSEHGPLAIHAAFAGDEFESPAPVSQVPPHVLVIDDDPFIRRLMQKLLSNSWRVTAMSSLHDGLNSARNLRPDALLADIHTPDWNGIEFVAALRQDRILAEIPVVILTGDETRNSLLSAFDAGADDYILKSDFTRVALLGKLQRAVESRRRISPKPIPTIA